MFLDGVTYAAIARNLAQGRGRFWAPHYTATIYPAFHEHPPLAFWLQAQWFRVLGDHWFVERAYSAAAAALVALFIVIIWRALHRGTGSRDCDWLPVALWMAAPVVSWSIVGNLLETTVSVFVAAAVAALIVTMRGSIAVALAGGTVSGLCVAGAALSKGPVGLFPLVAGPIMGLLVPRSVLIAPTEDAEDAEVQSCPSSFDELRLPGRGLSSRRSLLSCVAAQWATVLLCGALLVALPESRESLSLYLNEQVVTALAGRREVSSGSLTIVVALVQAVWLPMAVAAAAIVVASRPWKTPPPADRQIATAFMLLGLCGTLPMLISPKQTGHYLMPAIPFYALSFSAILSATVGQLFQRPPGRLPALAVRTAAPALVMAAAIAAALPVLEREPGRLADLDRLSPVAPRGAIAGICGGTNADWGLHAWFQRRFQMSLDATHPLSHEWFLRTAGDGGCAPAWCRAASDEGADLVLLRCDR
jgi:hypothetical protein